jgi:hypothetical protein
VESYLTARAACARYLDAPPKLRDLSTDDLKAWQAYGEIVYCMNRADLSREEQSLRQSPLWENLSTTLILAAIDPLFEMKRAACMGRRREASFFESIVSRFPSSVLTILENGFPLRERASGIFRPSRFDAAEREQFIVGLFGRLGNLHTAGFLEPLVDSPTLGRASIEALRQIHART